MQALQARLGATAQEAISADEIAGNLRLQRAHDQRELQREGEHGERREALLGELRAALATESGRVAKAWEQRERMRAAVGERDAQLRALQAEAFHLREDLAGAREQVAQLQEQRRLGEILLEGAEERSRLRAKATQEARDEAAQGAMQLASVSSQLEQLKETQLKTKQEALQRREEQVFGLQVANDGRQARIELLQQELAARSSEIVQLKAEIARRAEAERALREGELGALQVADYLPMHIALDLQLSQGARAARRRRRWSRREAWSGWRGCRRPTWRRRPRGTHARPSARRLSSRRAPSSFASRTRRTS